MAKDFDCFGFYTGGGICASCAVNRRCKAILVSDGFTIVAEFLEHEMASLPEGSYRDSDRIPELVDQMLNPTVFSTTTDEEESLLGLLGNEKGVRHVPFSKVGLGAI